MSVAGMFKDFRTALSVSNAADISLKYASITTRLNADFWAIESDQRNSLQTGSYGRHTAIDGVSDLDMVFELPAKELERYKKLNGNGPSCMLQEVRESLKKRYPNTPIKADGQVVGVFFDRYHVEVLPAFLTADGDYTYGDSNNGGSWKTTKPRPEIKAINELNKTTNGNLKDVCKMLRAWKNKAGVGIGGLLVDTFAYNFFSQTNKFNDATYSDYPSLFLALYTYLGALPEQDYWMAPGSGQRVRCKSKFQAKAKKAAKRCQEAIDAVGDEAQSKVWRKIFGKHFPTITVAIKASRSDVRDDEEFIEDRYPVDIRYNIELDCETKEANVLRDALQKMLRMNKRVPIGRHLRFHVVNCDVPGDYALFWKVRNQGDEAIRRKQLRGEIKMDQGRRERNETSNFSGNHYVEIYAVKDGVVVARDKINVPI
jgi:hypothetical protein